MDIETLLAKQEITDLVSRYMRGLDRLDKSLLRSTFYDDANTDYGFFKGGPDDFVDMAHNALKEHLANHHMIGQCLIDVEGDVAFGEIYFQAFHRIITDGEERDLFIAGRYVDRYERRVTEDGNHRSARYRLPHQQGQPARRPWRNPLRPPCPRLLWCSFRRRPHLTGLPRLRNSL